MVMKSPTRGSTKENPTKSPRLKKTNLAGSSQLFVDTDFADFPSWRTADGDHNYVDKRSNINDGANDGGDINSEELVELLEEEEEEALRPQLTRERTRRFELQERSNLRHQLNRSISSREGGGAVAESPIRRPRPPSRDDSWESGMLSNLMSMSDASPTADVVTASAAATAPIDQCSYWDVPASSTTTRRLQRQAGVHRQQSDAPSRSVDTPDTVSTGESDEESSTSEEGELVAESNDTSKADASEEDDQEDNDSWGSYQEENSQAQKVIARSVKRCSTTDWQRLVGDTSDKKNQSLRLLEEKNWWGAEAVVVAPTIGSSSSVAVGLQCINEEEEEDSQHQLVDDDSADSSTVCSGSNKSTLAPLSEMSATVKSSKAQSLSHRVPPARTRTGMLRDAFQRIVSATNLEWNEGKAMEPQEEVGGGSHERAHHIRSSRKTKKEESIAAASIVIPPSSKQREKTRSSCKCRGRRAVDAWRREIRHKKHKQKKIEQSRYAFNLEFDPFALKPVEFDNNVFRGADHQESPAPEREDPAEISEEQEDVQKEDKARDDVSVVSNHAWHREMEDLFATSPEKHRKNFVSRSEF